MSSLWLYYITVRLLLVDESFTLLTVIKRLLTLRFTYDAMVCLIVGKIVKAQIKNIFKRMGERGKCLEKFINVINM